MDINTRGDYDYLLEKMDSVEAISHLIHSRVFELLGYTEMLRKEETNEELVRYIERLEEISERLVSEFHHYLEYYHLGTTQDKVDFRS